MEDRPLGICRPGGFSFAGEGASRIPAATMDRETRRNGKLKWRGQTLFISKVLVGEPLGLFPIADDVWLVKYGPNDLGTLRGRAGLEEPGSGSPSRPGSRRCSLGKVLSMSSIAHSQPPPPGYPIRTRPAVGSGGAEGPRTH